MFNLLLAKTRLDDAWEVDEDGVEDSDGPANGEGDLVAWMTVTPEVVLEVESLLAREVT